MTAQLDDEATAGLLSDAMRAAVGAAVPPATIVSGLPRRAARRRARITAVGVAASVAVVAGAMSATRPRPAPAPLATSSPAESPPAVESPEPVLVPPPRMEAASLPPGFMYWSTGTVSEAPRDGSTVWPRTVTYARGFTDAGQPRTPILVTTTVDATDEIDVEDFPGATARWADVGRRRVVRVDRPPASRGYHWTDRPGVNVSVTAGAGVTDAELRQVVAALDLVHPAPEPGPGELPRLQPHDDNGVLYGEVRGRGSRTIGPIAVPAEFDVHTVCYGGELRVQIGSLRDGTYGCADADPLTNIVDRTGGVRRVTITLTTDPATKWAVLVTTSDGPPS